MAGWTVVALRAVIAIALFGAVLVQAAIVAMTWVGGDPAPIAFRLALASICVLGIGCLQVIGVCIWRLVTRVRRGTVFSHDSFRYVNLVIWALVGGAVLIFALAVLARFANHAVEGDEVAPGLVLLICGFSLVTAGVALVVYVLKILLAQAVDLDAEARHLKSELDVVI